jgi:hypothetical protein
MNVPVVYMAGRKFLMLANPFQGLLEVVDPKNPDFLCLKT